MGGPAGIEPQDWDYFPKEPLVCLECGRICSLWYINREMVCGACEEKFIQEESDERMADNQREEGDG